MQNFDFFYFFLLLRLLLLKAQFNFVSADILKNHGVHPVPLGKGSKLPGFSICLSKSIFPPPLICKRMVLWRVCPAAVFFHHFMNEWNRGYLQNEHWNGPKIKKLYSWSWSCQVVLGNFLFSELFNREYFPPAFRIYLYFCQKHTPRSRKFNVLPNFTCGKESWLVTWRAI